MKIALLPIGYWDGYDRKFAQDGLVRIGKDYCPVIGRISMNLTIIDITNVPHAKIGTEVILLDDSPTLNAYTVAEKMGRY